MVTCALIAVLGRIHLAMHARIGPQLRGPWLRSSYIRDGVALLLLVSLWGAELRAEQDSPEARGYRYLTEKAYLPPDFDQETFDELWTVWAPELRKRAETASRTERRQMAFTRYGLAGRPEDPQVPLQYVVDAQGNWTMNCFACHGGALLGKTYPGLPNSRFALETLTADVRKVKLKMAKPLTRMDVGSLVMPLGKTNGTTNAVMFGVALMAFRDAELNFRPERTPPKMIHHDMDAPAWWHFRKKARLYIDGFAEKGHRALMQFMLVQENGPEQFQAWEDDYRDVFSYLASVEPPRYPFAIDEQLAAQGKKVFEASCAHCHGTYGEQSTYPEKTIPLEELGTDPVRLQALTEKERNAYHRSWFGHFGAHDTRLAPAGYVAPPLDGIWASAPYLHNGAVPTLWHVLHPDERPAIWRRTEGGYDQQRVGLVIETYDALPASIRRPDELRTYFNTNRFGKSSAGHTFPDALSSLEKRAVLEYLKTL